MDAPPSPTSFAKRDASVSSSSLTFGFAFMGILLVMLIAASLLQRHLATRERAERLRFGLALDGLADGEDVYGSGNGKGVPKLWEVFVKPGDASAIEMPNMGGKRGKEEGKRSWNWGDLQPLAARAISDPCVPNSRQLTDSFKAKNGSASNTDLTATPPQPTHITMFIAMPVSPTIREARVRASQTLAVRSGSISEKYTHTDKYDVMGDSLNELGLQGLCYEIGLTEVKRR